MFPLSELSGKAVCRRLAFCAGLAGLSYISTGCFTTPADSVPFGTGSNVVAVASNVVAASVMPEEPLPPGMVRLVGKVRVVRDEVDNRVREILFICQEGSTNVVVQDRAGRQLLKVLKTRIVKVTGEVKCLNGRNCLVIASATIIGSDKKTPPVGMAKISTNAPALLAGPSTNIPIVIAQAPFYPPVIPAPAPPRAVDIAAARKPMVHGPARGVETAPAKKPPVPAPARAAVETASASKPALPVAAPVTGAAWVAHPATRMTNDDVAPVLHVVRAADGASTETKPLVRSEPEAESAPVTNVDVAVRKAEVTPMTNVVAKVVTNAAPVLLPVGVTNGVELGASSLKGDKGAQDEENLEADGWTNHAARVMQSIENQPASNEAGADAVAGEGHRDGGSNHVSQVTTNPVPGRL